MPIDDYIAQWVERPPSRNRILVIGAPAMAGTQLAYWSVGCIWDGRSNRLCGTAVALNDRWAITAAHVLSEFLQTRGHSRPVLSLDLVDYRYRHQAGITQEIHLPSCQFPPKQYFGRVRADLALLRLTAVPAFTAPLGTRRTYPQIGTRQDLVAAMGNPERLRICGFGAAEALPFGNGSMPDPSPMKRVGSGVKISRPGAFSAHDPNAEFFIADNPLIPSEVMMAKGDSGGPAFLVSNDFGAPVLLGINHCKTTELSNASAFFDLSNPEIEQWVNSIIKT